MSERHGPIHFQLKKFADYGSAHPAAARLFLQMDDLLGVTSFDAGTKDQIKQHLFRCADETVKAQRKKDAFLEKCRRFAEDMRAGRGIVAQTHVIELKEPEGLSDDFQLFLIHLTIALRMAIKAAAVVLIGRPGGWGVVKQTVEQRFPADHPIRELLAQHGSWTDSLFAARGEIEHDPFLFEGYKAEPSPTGLLQLADPKMPDGSSAVDAVARYYADGFIFSEELVARALESTFSHGFTLGEIPEERRDPAKPIRFVVQLPPGSPSTST